MLASGNRTAPIRSAKDSRLLGRTKDGTPAYLDWITVFGRTPDDPQATWFEHCCRFDKLGKPRR